MTGYPDRSDVLARVEPVYETLPGWRVGLGHARESDELPAEARDLIAVGRA